jgi:hypothetical protein
MATIVALTSNNWSSTTVDDPWPGGTKPGAGDTVQTDQFVIEIDEDITVSLLEATSTGYFSVAAIAGDGTRTITADVLNSGTSYAALMPTYASGILDIVGDISGGGGGLGLYTEIPLGTITGNIAGGSGSDICGVECANINAIVGNITGGSVGGAFGVKLFGTCLSITGDITGGGLESNACGVAVANGGITEIVGNISGNNNSIGLLASNSTLGTIVGNITAGANQDAFGVSASGCTAFDFSGILVSGAAGCLPVSGMMRLVAAATNAMTFLDTTDSPLTLSNDYPAVADVKDGVTYKLGTLEGELVAGGISNVTVVIGGNVCRRA